MAHTKAGGTTKGNRDSVAKRLGVKKYAGEKVLAGNIIVRQKGSRIHAGNGVSTGRDFTLFAIIKGIVKFKTLKGKKVVEVING